MTPLSIIHFPEGGALSVIECDPETARVSLSRKETAIRRPGPNGKWNLGGKIWDYPRLRPREKTIKMKPGWTAIFRFI